MSPLQYSTLQKKELKPNGVFKQSSGQLTKCDCTLILGFSLIIRYHINTERKIWNSAVHNPATVWCKYCQLHLSSLQSWSGGICCAAPSLVSKIKITHGKRFSSWTQEVCLECRAWTAQDTGQPAKNNLPGAQEKPAMRRWIPVKCSPCFLYMRSSEQ